MRKIKTVSKKVIPSIAIAILVISMFASLASATHSTSVTITPTSTEDNHRELFEMGVVNNGPDTIESAELILPGTGNDVIAGLNAYIALRDAAEDYGSVSTSLGEIGQSLSKADNYLSAYGDVLVENVVPKIKDAGQYLIVSSRENAEGAGVDLRTFGYRLEEAGNEMAADNVDFSYIGSKVSAGATALDSAGDRLAGDTNENLQAAGENLKIAAEVMENVADNLSVGNLYTSSLHLADASAALIAAGEALQGYVGSGDGDINGAGATLIEAANNMAKPYEPEVTSTVIVEGKSTSYTVNNKAAEPIVEWENNHPIIAVSEVDSGAVAAAGTGKTAANGGADDNYAVLLDEIFQWMISGATDVLWYGGHGVYEDSAECSNVVDNLESMGYSVTGDDTEPITSSLLSSYDIVVLPTFQEGSITDVSESEYQALANFAKNGGGLFVSHESDYYASYYGAGTDIMSKILTTVGFDWRFNDDTVEDATANTGGSYMPIVDVDTTHAIGSGFQSRLGKSEIGTYSICSLSPPLPRARQLYVAGSALKSAGVAMESVTEALSGVGDNLVMAFWMTDSPTLYSAGENISDAAENLASVDATMQEGAAVVNDNLASAASDLSSAALALGEKIGGSGIGVAADNLAAAAGVMKDVETLLGDAGTYFTGASSGFSSASDEVGDTAETLEPPLFWNYDGVSDEFVSYRPDSLGTTLVSGQSTSETIDQTGWTPSQYYETGEYPPIIATAEVGDGKVVAGGVAATCRDGNWNDGEWDVFLDNSFQWMVSGAEDVLWYEGHSVYNDTTQCSNLVDNLENMGYSITGDSTDPIDSTLLADYQILVIPQIQDPSGLSGSEVSAIDTFVSNGGGLLIMDGSDYQGHNYWQIQNNILRGLDVGIMFQSDQVSDSTNNQYGDHAPLASVDTSTWIGSAYENATDNTEIGVYSTCSLVVAETDPGITNGEEVTLPFLWIVPPNVNDQTIQLKSYDVPYGSSYRSTVTVSVDSIDPEINYVNADQDGTPRGLIGSVHDGGTVSVEVQSDESLSKLANVFVVDISGDNLTPPLNMTPDADNVNWTGEFTVDNSWSDQRVYVRVMSGSEDIAGNDISDNSDSTPIQVVNSAPIITDNGFAAARSAYTDLMLETNGGVKYVTDNSMWTISGELDHVDNYFDSLRFDENWWPEVSISVDGTEFAVEDVLKTNSHFTFSDSQIDLGDDGPKTITLTVVDAAGNVSENIQDNIFVDNTAPTVSFDEIAGQTFESGIRINENRPTIDLTVSDPGYPSSGIGILENEDVEWTLYDSTMASITVENQSPLDNVRAGDAEISLALPTAADDLDEGTYTLKVQATDGINPLADNWAQGENIQFVVDVTAPGQPDLETRYPNTTRDSPRVLTETSLTLRGTAEAGSTINVYLNDEVTTTATATSAGEWNASVSLPTAEVAKIEVSATDVAGNEGNKQLYGYVMVDAEPPTVTITAPEDGKSTEEKSVTLEGTVSDPNDLTAKKDIEVWVSAPGFAVPQMKVYPDTNGNFTVNVPLTEGSNTISVLAKDDAGNTSPAKTVSVKRTVTSWAMYATIAAIVAIVLAAIAVLRRSS